LVSEAFVLARILNCSRLLTLHELWHHPARGRKRSVLVVASGMCRLRLQSADRRAAESASVLTPSAVILSPVLGLKLVGRHLRLAVTVPDAIEKGSSLACPSILGSVIHLSRLQDNALPSAERELSHRVWH
jgi:hypothetical protein